MPYTLIIYFVNYFFIRNSWIYYGVYREVEVDEIKQQKIESRIVVSHVTPPHVLDYRRKLNRVIGQLRQGYKGIDPHRPPSGKHWLKTERFVFGNVFITSYLLYFVKLPRPEDNI